MIISGPEPEVENDGEFVIFICIVSPSPQRCFLSITTLPELELIYLVTLRPAPIALMVVY